MNDTYAEHILQRHAARNFWLNVLDGGAFILGLSLVSRFTILPLFVERLSSEAWLQGLIPAITYCGWSLPGLFMAPLVSSMPRRKPFVLLMTLGERLPFLVLGLVLLLWPTLPAGLLLGLFFALYTLYALSSGLTALPWQDLIARVIPGQHWGVFFGLHNGLGGVLGIGGAALTASILASQPFPQSIGILSLLCFAAMVVSWLFLSGTVEPPQATAPRQSMRGFLGGILPLLRRDHTFRRYLFCRAAIALGLTGHSFVTAAALARFTLEPRDIASYTAALLVAQAIGDIGLGTLADRWGHKQVLELSTGLGLLALLLAVLAPAPVWFVPIFVLVGVAQSGYQLSGFTLIFSFSTPAERPTYIGVANTAIAPVAALGPLLAGVVAGQAGYAVLFIGLLLIGLAGLLALHWRVPAPARIAPAPVVE